MKKQKENLFSTKFRLLNSQEHSEEIIWSSSECSEFEEVDYKPNFSNITNKKPCRKRKRKTKVPCKVPNLNVTINDSIKDSRSAKSPVLTSRTKSKTFEGTHEMTHLIEVKPEYNTSKAVTTSPVLCTGQTKSNICMTSPVIAQKYASPAHSPNVRKILFNDNENSQYIEKIELDRRKIIENNLEKQFDKSTSLTHSIRFQDEDHRVAKAGSSSKRINVDLIKKVKSFFESHFNSENSSQHSIADTLTPKPSLSDDVEILSMATQINSCEATVQSIKHTNSTDNSEIEAEKSKKIRYKKDGLAYRLNGLLKKHNANISLWQHERFLAENSNFKIPKGEHLVFRIRNVSFKFGCFLLEATDVNAEVFFILVNKSYVNNCTFKEDFIFKLYEPYQIFNFVDRNKLIINVCKFECVPIDNLL